MELFTFELWELLEALPSFISPMGEHGNLAWHEKLMWLVYIGHIFATMAGPFLLSAVTLSAIHYRVRSGITRWLYQAAWVLFAMWLGFCLCLWLMGYWLLAVPVGILVIVVWILA